MQGNVSFALLLSLLAGLSTGIGSALAFFMGRPKPWHMSLSLGFSAGVMVYISFAELLHAAIERVGFATANLGFFVGILFIALLDILIPHEYKQERVRGSGSQISQSVSGEENEVEASLTAMLERRSRIMRAGVLTAIGIAIHNFPEGLAVFSSAITGDLRFGLIVAIAIAVHNIPEGISVSVPIAEATGNRRRAFLYSFAAGLAEPVGAILGYVILFPFLTPTLVYALLAFSGGIMVYISLDELLPTAHLFGQSHLVIVGVVSGMLIMAITLLLMPR